MINRYIEGASYISQGLKHASKADLRPWVAVPLLLNIVLFSYLFYQAGSEASAYLSSLASGDSFSGFWSFLNGPIVWLLDALSWLVWVLLFMMFAAVFPSIVNLVAGPFNGFLAEKTAINYCSAQVAEESIPALCLRTFKRELSKLRYWVVRAIGLFFVGLILSLIPGLNLLVPVMWGAFSAWVLAMQYLDYGADLEHKSINEMVFMMKRHRWQVLGFGSLSLLLTSVPIVNLVIIPVSVVGGTLLWNKIKD